MIDSLINFLSFLHRHHYRFDRKKKYINDINEVYPWFVSDINKKEADELLSKRKLFFGVNFVLVFFFLSKKFKKKKLNQFLSDLFPSIQFRSHTHS